MCKYDGGFHFRLADIFRKYLLIVTGTRITIYIAFDGLLLPAKASEVEQRQRWEYVTCWLLLYLKQKNVYLHRDLIGQYFC
jgi:hypothetical protein